MRERFVVNLRVPAEAAPVPKPLQPQLVGGWAVASFCVLDLHNITIAPLPTVAGWRSRSCAERWGALDPEPSVYVAERLTSSRVGSAFTHLGFSAPHSLVDLDVVKDRRVGRVRASVRGTTILDARLARDGDLASSVFDDVTSFSRFLADGVRSYGPSRHTGRLTVLDLHKRDTSYEPLAVEEATGSFIDSWTAVGAEIDSAFRTVDADYEWRYHGLLDAAR